MKIDVIITTYNRPLKVLDLVNELLPIMIGSGKVIVVDSSENKNILLNQKQQVIYLRSSHKNQPYQRYLGYLASESEFLVFLDDDMEVVDTEFLLKLDKIFEDKTISGVAIYFENKHEDSLLAQIPRSKLFKKLGFISKAKGWFSGYPEMKPGAFGLCGNRGKQPALGEETEWLSGGAFAARRSAMFQNFNFQLFDIYEQKLGKGEDLIIGYGLSKQGRLLYHPELFFLHNDQRDSTYTSDLFSFSMRVIYSRKYLSLEKTRLDYSSFLYANLHFHWYTLFRILGLIANFLLKSNDNRKKMLTGALMGWRKSFGLKFDKTLESNMFWKQEALKDLNNA